MGKRFVLGLAVFLMAFMVGLSVSPLIEETMADEICGQCIDEHCVAFKSSCIECSPTQNCYRHYTGTCSVNGCCGSYIYTHCCPAGIPC